VEIKKITDLQRISNKKKASCTKQTIVLPMGIGKSGMPRRKEFTEEEDIEQNVEDAKDLPESYVEIYPDSNLAFSLETESFFILMYEMTCCPRPQEGPRFLATMGVFTCIALFARSASGRAFAAHIPISACHFVLPKRTFLNEVTSALKLAFRNESMKDVKVSLVGGQGAQDDDKALGCKFSTLVKQCVLKAGISDIDDRLLNIFPGVRFHRYFEEDQAEKHQSFQLAALDRETGHVVVHTRSSIRGYYSVPALGKRNDIEKSRYVQSVGKLNFRGQQCKIVKW
jgi:hypothetical protein